MARPAANPNPEAGKRLKWACEAIRLKRADLLKDKDWIANDLCASTRQLRHWIKDGVPQVSIEGVAVVFGMAGREFSEGEISEEEFKELVRERAKLKRRDLRRVEKIICLVGRKDENGVVRLLSYDSPDWQADLLPNLKLPEKADDDKKMILNLLAYRLQIKPSEISMEFDRNDESMRSDCVKETGDPHKARVHGKEARYGFHYCTATIPKLKGHLLQDEFECHDIRYAWRTLAQLKSDPRVKELNSDVLGFISEKFDATLYFFPFQERNA